MNGRLVITGATGYLGTEVVDQARTLGYEVFEGSSAVCDLRDSAAVRRWVGAIRPDAIVHTAAVTGGSDLWAVTALGAGAVAEAASACHARLVHVSTDMVFNGDEHRYPESAAVSPLTLYGEAKAEAERLVRSRSEGASIVRTSIIYGSGFPPRAIGMHERVVLDAVDGVRPFTFFHDEIRCPVHVSDLARALLDLVARADASGVFHVVGDEAVSRASFARRIAAVHGRDPGLVATASIESSPSPRPRRLVLSAERIRDALGRVPRGMGEVCAVP